MAYIFQNGSGTELDPFIIETLQDLEGIKDVDSEGLPNYENKWYILGNDINFEGYNWNPIHNLSNIHFNGMNHKFYNLSKIDSSYYDPINIVDYAQLSIELENSTISNLVLDNIYFDITLKPDYIYASISILVGCYINNSIIDNVKIFNAEINVDNQGSGIGGISADLYNNTIIQNCVINNFIIRNTGGWVNSIQGIASEQSDCIITNCKINNMNVSSLGQVDFVGGIVGIIKASEISNNLVTNSIFDLTDEGIEETVGGIQGKVGVQWAVGNDTDIINCEVINLDIINADYSGGIVGEFVGDTISTSPYVYGIRDCQAFNINITSLNGGGICYSIYNRQHIKNTIILGLNLISSAYAGGIVAFQGAGAYFENCIQQGQITQDTSQWGYQSAGGIAQHSSSASFLRCGQDVDIITTSDVTSQQGFIGEMSINSGYIGGSFASIIENCYQLGSITSFDGQSVVQAGFIGSIYGNEISGNEINTSYSQTSVPVLSTGTSNGFSGTIPTQDITYTNNFYDSDQSGHVDTNGQTPLTTLQIKDESNLTGFDFINTWKIGAFTGTENEYISDINGNYYFSTSDGNKILYIEYDPSNGYPYLQFETKKEIVVNGDTRINLFVR